MAAIGPKRADGTYRARYRDRAGKEHARHFKRRVDAQRWLDETTTSLVTGAYVAPGAGRITFREYAQAWRAVQIHRAGTLVQVEGALRRRVYPVIGDRPLESIVASDIQQLVKRLERELSPASVIVTYRYVATIFKAASRDRRIALSPCDRIRLPKIVKKPVAPMATSDIQSLAEAVPKRYQAMVILAAGTGLRQGEIFGLTLDRVDFLRRSATVDRQLVGIQGQAPTFGPPRPRAAFGRFPCLNSFSRPSPNTSGASRLQRSTGRSSPGLADSCSADLRSEHYGVGVPKRPACRDTPSIVFGTTSGLSHSPGRSGGSCERVDEGVHDLWSELLLAGGGVNSLAPQGCS